MGRDPLLPGAQGQGSDRSQLSGDGAVAAQPGELRRLQSRSAEVGRRHRRAVPARRAEAVLRSIPEDRRAQSRHAARVHLQHRRESLGPPAQLAAGLRKGLRRAAEAALSAGRFRLGIRQAGSSRRRCGFLRLRSRQARALSSAAGALRRFRPLENLAGHRSAHRGRPDRRADVPNGRAHRAGAHWRRARSPISSPPPPARMPIGW